VGDKEEQGFGGAVLVTGGSRGIGRAVVEVLCAEGRPVAFTWRSKEKEAREVEERTGAVALPYDLSDRARPSALVEETEDRLGPLFGLVNNAGFQRSELLAMTSDASWDATIDGNLGGAFRCCRAALRSMVRRRSGAIVNVASLSARHGVAGLSAYAASKAGILAMTRCLAREMGKRNVRVNAVVPGFVATEMTGALPAAAVEGLRAGECLARGATTDAIAHAVAFLLSERAASITGQEIVVDAGASA